jgi:hypothetical protein
MAMDAIQYLSSTKGNHVGIWIDLLAVKKSVKKKKDLVALMEDIEDIVALELSKDEKSVPYEEARQRIFAKKK